ncbi:hypothetical protein [Clostridium botulinum]|uniref:hypothetical protein n=1 Tax=Clostridium botulinum TaxID=1491 RepID=UPI001E388326|nr:hypothetical protein [Clostridium botulinum]MCD3252350.1 hypothetical protein [Clostridium botulinum C/D]MCD3277986.1 hypothetical protein [Clostridium botulinum C/D]MCD3281499.1 hypothetical protein [Clostridium botulinum C/D]MCD3340348.1 hypothetical protein [Clostridium botulinum C/D]MCD3355911.1 hypothetical protein [Clostridium botulinum C/D]
MAKITIENIGEYQNRLALVKANGFKVKDFKELGRELRDTFDLTDRQAINILNNKSEEILKILEEE